ncbi:MAG: SDR family NAD(P)-dependent oxidoreductase [Candidatus Ornithospirochaeta sp.]
MKIALVTGASSGMGRDFARILDTYGLDEIWVAARREERLVELKKELKTKVIVLPMDITKKESIDFLKEKLEKEKADVKYLVNAAGFGVFGEFTENDAAQSEMVTLNSKALVDVTYTALPFMKEGSGIINLGSNSSWQPVPYMAVYGATKAFVLSFSRALAMEVKRKGIKVIAVCPGWIRTEFFDRAVHDDTIVYYDRFYESMDVVKKAMKDLEKGKLVSILGLPVRMQVRLVKLLPVKMVMKTWLRQQKKPL